MAAGMRRLLAGVVVGGLLVAGVGGAGARAATEFSDVPSGALFQAEISWLADRGVTTGWPEPDGTTTYRPLSPINRDAMAAFLHRLAGSPPLAPPALSPFADVGTGDLFYPEIHWAHQQGITTGWTEPDGSLTFRPLQPMNRDAMAAFLYRYAGRPAYTAPKRSWFVDVDPDALFYTEMSWLASRGISTGWAEPAGCPSFRPGLPIARDAMAAFLHRHELGGLTPPTTQCGPSLPDDTTLDSRTPSGGPADNWSQGPVLSADGRMVAFSSAASNLVAGDTNGFEDVFLRDRYTGSTRRVSVGAGGAQGNEGSTGPAISADGRFVAFSSGASNLVPGDTNDDSDVFVWDRDTGAVTRESVSSSGAEANSGSFASGISADGSWVVFYSDAGTLVDGDNNSTSDVFLRNRRTAETVRVSVSSDGREGAEDSWSSAMSADGRWVAFRSASAQLVPGDNATGADIFLWDRDTRTTTAVSIAPDGSQANDFSSAPAISADGRWVAYRSAASNLVPGDTNGTTDVFAWDRLTRTTVKVTAAPDGTGADDDSYAPSLSADGRWLGFHSDASNLVAADTNNVADVFVRDLATAVTRRVSVAPDAAQAVLGSDAAAISADGRWVAYTSQASNLVAGDTNNTGDVFVTRNAVG